jgi:lipoprotein NlpI
VKLLQALAEGQSALRERDYEKARDAFTVVVEEDPTFSEGFNRRATAEFYLGNIGKTFEVREFMLCTLAGKVVQ